jgi:hypothetical protein
VRIYVDWPWSENGRKYGAPFRAYIHTRRWFYAVGVKSQVWTEREGATDRFAHITRMPERSSIYDRVHALPLVRPFPPLRRRDGSWREPIRSLLWRYWIWRGWLR